MANNVPQAPQRPDVPEQNLPLSGDVFIPAQVSAGQVPVLNRSELKLPSNLKVFWMLLKVQITMIWTTQVMGARKNFEKKVGANALPIVGGIFAVVGALIMMVYIYGVSTGVALAGFTRLLPLAGILFGALPGVILTFVKANGVLFAYKDYDFIMSLPIKKSTIIYSRVAALYAVEGIWSFAIMLPVFLAYFTFEAVTIPRLIGALFALVLGPNLAVSAAILLAFAVAALAAKLHFKSLGMVIGGIFGLLFMVAYLFFIFTLSFNADKLSAGAAGNFQATVFSVASSVGLVYLPSLWIADFFRSGSFVSFLLFVLVSVGAPAVIVAIISRFNDRINALVSEDKVQKKFTTKQISTKSVSPFVALIRKEIQTIIGYPAVFVNMLFGCLLMVILAFISLFFNTSAIVANFVPASEVPRYLPLARTIFGMATTWFGTSMFCAANSAAISYSLEGRSNWLMATMPVSSRQIFGAKIAVNMLYVAFFSILTQVFFLIPGHITIETALRNVILPLCIVFLVANVGLAIDIRRPNFDWTSVIDITKRSLSVTVSSLVGTLGSMIVIGGTFMLMILPVIDSFSSSTGMVNETLPNVVFVTLSLLNAVIGALIFNNTVHRGVRI
ncbi:hypothetical protein [Lancefieldella parvula]|uniref:hypothetical protein n=1 Tax=Lancefieldella parvula TaxID=1382 RepID=UPI00290ACA1B|nr:hypothetical protein [Lancefieldella parvula]MDU4868299.1 hypothetical protein [Lancefieldella parvula]